MQKFQDYYGEETTVEPTETTEPTNTTEPTETTEEEATTYGPIHILSPLPPIHSIIAGYFIYDDYNSDTTTYADYKTPYMLELATGIVGATIQGLGIGLGAPFDMVATYAVYGDFVMQAFFLYKVNSISTTAAPGTHKNLLLALNGLAFALDGAIAVTDFLAAKKATTEEEYPEENTTEPTNSTETTEEPTTDGYYWARLNLLI